MAWNLEHEEDNNGKTGEIQIEYGVINSNNLE